MERYLTTKAVYWAPDGVDAFGEPTTASPQEILVRVEHSKSEDSGPSSTPVEFDYLVGVSSALSVSGFLWIGALTDIEYPVENLLQVVDYEEIPNHDGTEFDRWVKARKYTDTSPNLT